MMSRDKVETVKVSESQREVKLLLLVGTLLCIITGWWCWYVADTQHLLIPALLWISAAALLVIAVLILTQKQEIFFQQSIDNNLDRKESLI